MSCDPAVPLIVCEDDAVPAEATPGTLYILTEDGFVLITENGDPLRLE